jgi:hypothetical protein
MGERQTRSSSTAPAQGAGTTRLDPLDRLRSMRVRPDRAKNLQGDMTLHMKSIRKVSRAESAIQQAWIAAAPDAIAGRCRVIGMHSGRIEFAVQDSSSRYQTDRWLRGGGLTELSALAKIPIRGVRFKIVTSA